MMTTQNSNQDYVDGEAGTAAAETGTILPGIEHIVVLMFENRSFDNVLGGLYPDETPGKYDGLTGNECVPGPSGDAPVCVWQAPTGLDAMTMPYPDPGELFADMNDQIFGNQSGTGPETMQGFVLNYLQQLPSPDGAAPIAQNIMQYYAPGPNGNIPITSMLAQAYAVSDQWFASGPVQTLANRIFAHCATPSRYQDDNGTWFAVTDNTDITNQYTDPDGTVLDKCVFELLDDAGSSWKVYYHDWPLSAFIKYVDDHWATIFDGNVYKIDEFTGGGFFDDINNGNLPVYSFIEPRYTDTFGGTPNSNHPGGSDIEGNPPAISVCDGEVLLQSIYTALYNGPNQLFEKTLLIVIYDEHGGLYDHVAPPLAVSPFAAGDVTGFNYDRYGVRIPAIFINPFIAPGTIFRPQPGSNPFDHTSLISTLCAQFGLNGPLTPRDASAPTLEGLIVQSGSINPFSPDRLPSLTCPPPATAEISPDSLRSEPPPDSINAAIKKAIQSPRNQSRVQRLTRT
jgi:phospholipase C